MLDVALGLPNRRNTPFVDPWSKEPNHQGTVPADAIFVGAWDNFVGIDNVSEALFLVRSEHQDLLWSLTTWSEKTIKESLAARESGGLAWMKHEISSGCVAGAPREGRQSDAAAELLNALVRARAPLQFPRPPYLGGLLASNELSEIARAATDEFERNTLAAKDAQQRQKAQIVEVAGDLGLNPRPAGYNDSAWIADCPRRSHTLMLSPSRNKFGCGYCQREGDAVGLRAFVGFVAASVRGADQFDQRGKQ